MLAYLAEISDAVSIFNVFRYITFRTGGALITAALIVFIFGPPIIDSCVSSRARASRSALMVRRPISRKRARRRWAG